MRRTVLIWGPRYQTGHWDGELEDTLRLAGWEVYRSPRDYGDPEKEAQATLGLIREIKPHYFLTSHVAWVGGPSVAVLRRYQDAGCRTVTWSHDEPYRWDGYDTRAADQAPGYSLWFTNWGEPDHLARHTAGRVVWSPCASLRAFRPKDGLQEPQDIPVGFLGVYYPPRDPYLRAVKDLGLVAHMKPRTEKPHHRWPPPPDIRVCCAPRAGDLSPDQVASICRRSRLSLDIAEQPDGRVRCPKNRMFETTAAGSFTLAGRCPQTERLFRDGEHLILYDDAEDLRQKAQHYLSHPEEAQQIARAGSRWALAQHTWQHRGLQISREMDADLFAPNPKVGVVIPTCNRAELFRRAYESVAGLPIVVVNTGQQEIAPGRFMQIEAQRAGPSEARNLGVAALPPSVEWVRFLDDDDLALAGWEEAIQAGLEGKAAMIVGSAISTDPKTARNPGPQDPYTSQILVRRDAFRAVGGFDPTIPLAEERDLLDRLAAAGYGRWETDHEICYKGGEDPHAQRMRGSGQRRPTSGNARWARFH